MENRCLKCDRCGTVFASGDPAWRVRLSLTADPVQGMAEYGNMSDRQIDDRLNALLKRIEMIPGDMLENQVFQEFSFIVCGKCRSILAANPLQQP